jgi:transposase
MWTNENRTRYDRSKLRYPSDVTDAEWALVGPLIPPAKRGGGKRTVEMRAVVNGLMYVLSTGCQWRAIPKDLPPKSTVVLGVKCNDTFYSWGKANAVAGTEKEIADRLPLSAWKRLSAGSGTKGERLHEWVYLEVADLAGGDYNEAQGGQVWTRGLLIRRKIADGDLAFFTTWAPSGTTIDVLTKIEGHRWAIEDSFETAKNELGLDHNETRSWHGGRRHVSLVMLAFAMMATIRVHANGPSDAALKKIRRAMTTKAARPRSTAN